VRAAGVNASGGRSNGARSIAPRRRLRCEGEATVGSGGMLRATLTLALSLKGEGRSVITLSQRQRLG
jgi:hypothetical protein